MAAVAAEAIEGASAGEAGVNAIGGLSSTISSFKSLFSGSVGLYSSITDLLSSKDKRKDIIQKFRDKWHDLGLVIPEVDIAPSQMNGLKTVYKRNELVAAGVIPREYSSENIVELIKKDKLPSGWDKGIVVNQGFGPLLHSRGRINQVKNLDLMKAAQEESKLEARKSLSYFDEKNKNAEARRIASGFRLY